jgi:hypothetical protein
MSRNQHRRPSIRLLLLLPLALGACQSAGAPGTPTTAAQPTEVAESVGATPATLAPTAAVLPAGDAAARDQVLAAMRAQLSQPKYRVEQTSIAGGNVGRRTIEYVAPDRMRVVEEQTDGTTEAVIIGGAGWRKINGNWQPDAFMARAQESALKTMGDPAVVNDLAGKIGAVVHEGQLDLNGQATQVYRYETVTGLEGNPITSVTRLWVRDSDGLPVKQEVVGKVSDTESTTVMVFTYDPAMSIEVPMQ